MPEGRNPTYTSPGETVQLKVAVFASVMATVLLSCTLEPQQVPPETIAKNIREHWLLSSSRNLDPVPLGAPNELSQCPLGRDSPSS